MDKYGIYLVLKSSIKVEINHAQSNYLLQDVKVESIVKASVGWNSLAWLLLIHSLLQMVLPETMATHAFCHALYEWEKKQQKYAGQERMGGGHMQHIFLPVCAFSRSPAAGLKANAPVPIFGADFTTQP